MPHTVRFFQMSQPSISVPQHCAGRDRVYAIACDNGWNQHPAIAQACFAPSYDNEYLYISFKTTGPVRCVNNTDQSPVSQDSCVEFFIQPHQGGEYWNFEFNCAGFLNASHRMTRPEPTRLDAAQLAMVKRTPGNIDALVEGTTAQWTLDVAIPWALLGIEPHKGLKMRANVYACASKTNPPYYLSFAPVNLEKPDYHRPEFFVDIMLD